MKKWIIAYLLTHMAVMLSAETVTTDYRGLSQYGIALSIGRDSGIASPGFGVSYMSFTYFDPTSKNGLYYSILSDSFLIHVINNSAIADSKPFVLGYFQSLGNFPISVGANIGPVIGARYDGNLLLGSAYTGIGSALTVYIKVLPNIDLGISFEPVLNIATWGAPNARDLNYSDFVLYTVFTNHYGIIQREW